MSDYYDDIEYRGFILRIRQDCDPGMSPDDWDHDLAFLAYVGEGSSRYALTKRTENLDNYLPWGEGKWETKYGEAKPPSSDEEATELYEEWESQYEGGYVVFPCRVCEYGGGNSRFYKCDLDRAEYAVFVKVARSFLEKLSNAAGPSAWEIAEPLIEAWDQYVSGEVYWYEILPGTGDGSDAAYDSCCGFYGNEYCVQSAKEQADYYAEKTETAHVRLILADGTWREEDVEIPLCIGPSAWEEWLNDEWLEEGKGVVQVALARAEAKGEAAK